MVHNKVFEPVSLSDLSKNKKVIDTTLDMKKKSSGTLRGRVNVRGFNSLTAKSVLAGEKLVATYSIST